MTVLIKAEWDKKFNERERDSEAIFLMAAEVCLGYVYRTTDDGTYIGHMGSGFSAPITYVGADLDEAKRSVEAQCGAFAPAPAEPNAAGHGWITGTADVDAMNAAAADAAPSSPPQSIASEPRGGESPHPSAAGGDLGNVLPHGGNWRGNERS